MAVFVLRLFNNLPAGGLKHFPRPHVRLDSKLRSERRGCGLTHRPPIEEILRARLRRMAPTGRSPAGRKQRRAPNDGLPCQTRNPNPSKMRLRLRMSRCG